MDSHSVPMDMDVPKLEAIDTDTTHSSAEEFEELLFHKQCEEIIYEIHRVQRKLCYGCMFNRPDSWTMIFVSLIGKRKWTIALTKLLRTFHWVFCWKT